MDKKLMIYPKAKECDNKKCLCSKPHYYHDPQCRRGWCSFSDEVHACIPYVEPSPKDKCDHIYVQGDGLPICEKCGNVLLIRKAKPQPETRPLIDDLDNKFSETICSACLQGMQRDTCPYPQPCNGLHDALVNIKLLFQAWHKNEVQQVLKDFAEKCIKGLPALSKGDEECCESCAFFIMEMAEKE